MFFASFATVMDQMFIPHTKGIRGKAGSQKILIMARNGLLLNGTAVDILTFWSLSEPKPSSSLKPTIPGAVVAVDTIENYFAEDGNKTLQGAMKKTRVWAGAMEAAKEAGCLSCVFS